MMRVANVLHLCHKAVQKRRGKISDRFNQPNGGLRLIMLGVLLIDLAVIALSVDFFNLRLPDYWPGMASIFGGLLISIIIIRISRPKLFWDWIALGTLHTTLGFLLTKSPSLWSSQSFVVFCALLLATAILRLWIGATLVQWNGRSYLLASGLTGLFCTGWAVATRLTSSPTSPDFILAVDLLITGLSIAGLGLSLRQSPS